MPPLVTVVLYGGLFYCIPCRCSIRWLLVMWAYEKTPLYYYGRSGQLCFSKDYFLALWYTKYYQCMKCKRLQACYAACFSVFFYLFISSATFEYFPSSFCSIYLGRVWFPLQTGRVPPPLSNIRNANGWWGWGLSSCLRGNRCWVMWWFPPQITAHPPCSSCC